MRRKYIPIDIDGDQWRVRLSLGAMAHFEELTGRDLGEVLGSLVLDGSLDKTQAARAFIERVSARTMRAIVFAVLHPEHPDLTLEAAGELLHAGNILDVWGQLQAALVQFLPQGQEAEEAGPFVGPGPGTGIDSRPGPESRSD